MKHTHKRYLFLLLVTLCTLPAMSQVGELRNNFSIGFNGGVNYNKISFTPTVNQSGLIGYSGGFTARYISEKYFAMICGVQIEVNYTQRGWKELIEEDLENDIPESNPYSRTMNYVEIPFLAHLAFGRERGARFFINIGPQIAFLLNESEKFIDIEEGSSNRPQYGKFAERKFDYGIAGGAGLELRTKAGNFLIEGRYYFGLADVFDNARGQAFSRSAHNIISGKITYLFDLTK